MAELIEDAAPAPEPARGGRLALIVALVVTTLAGGAGGAFVGMLAVERIGDIATRRANEVPIEEKEALAWDKGTTTTRLDPVIVNLTNPAGARVRLDTAMVFDVEAVDDVERMKAVLSQDILAFLRTVSLGELQGASAFNYLRDDLNERVRVASGGTVKELLIEAMILQ